MRIAKGLLKIMMLPVVMILGIVSALGNTFMKHSGDMSRTFWFFPKLVDFAF